VLALHRLFARLPDEPQAVLEFVSQYGFLGLSGQPASEVQSERVGDILKSRDELRGVIKYVDTTIKLIRQLDREAKGMRIEGREVKGEPEEFRQIAAGLFNQWAVKYMRQFQPTLVRTVDRFGRPAVGLQMQPRTLLASMWLSVAEEIQGGVPNRLCVVCGKPLAPGSRIDKKTCSVACRKKLNPPKAKRQVKRTRQGERA
jgi:predicted nucleic acid-binding Zn ribbon protein